MIYWHDGVVIKPLRRDAHWHRDSDKIQAAWRPGWRFWLLVVFLGAAGWFVIGLLYRLVRLVV